MADKKIIPAKAMLNDIRAGFSDEEIMEKYGVSAKGIESLLGKLVAAGALKQSEIDARSKLFSESVNIDAPPIPAPTLSPIHT